MADTAKKKWEVVSVNRELANELAQECQIDPLVALILAGRGYSSSAQIESFLGSDEPLADPYEMIDMDRAVDRIRYAVENRESIAVYGDYDCDGVTATCLLYSYLRSKDAQVTYLLPNRMVEGYGMHPDGVDRLYDQGVKLIITVDNGIRAHAEIAYAAQKGMDVVVCDHHLPGETLPEAVAIVDPHRADCPSSFRDYAGVGVAFKLICALEDVSCEELLPEYADWVALGTVADVVPLVGENRRLVQVGLQMLSASRRPGLRALIIACGLQGKTLTAEHIGYGLAPRINAAGRLAGAQTAMRLLLCDEETQAVQLARELCDLNELRHEIENEIIQQGCAMVEANPSLRFTRVLVLAGEGWHEGVLGIAAARMAERYGHPTIMISIDGDKAKGSGRSVGDFDLHSAMEHCREFFTAFGGHKQAAGCSLAAEDVGAFREKINAYAARLGDLPFGVRRLDCKLNPGAIDVNTAQVLHTLEPLGHGNPSPEFGLFQMRLDAIQSVGVDHGHLRLRFSRDHHEITAMLFSVRREEFHYCIGDVLDLAVSLGVNVYHGVRSVSIVIREIRFTNESPDIFSEIRLYEAFRRGDQLTHAQYMRLIPERKDFAAFYRFLQQHQPCRFSPEVLACKCQIGYAATCVMLDIMEQLHIITRNKKKNGTEIVLIPVSEKKDLESAAMMKELRQQERGSRSAG